MRRKGEKMERGEGRAIHERAHAWSRLSTGGPAMTIRMHTLLFNHVAAV